MIAAMRQSTTLGFAVAPADRARLDHLTDVFAGGNRSEYLRRTLDVMEKIEFAEQLSRLQTYGEHRLVEAGISYDDIPRLVAEALANPDPAAVAQAKLIVASLRQPHRARNDGPRHPVAEIAAGLLRTSDGA